jgi:hypothetical protein
MYYTKKQMRGCKLLKIEGAPKLGIFELRDGKYWDGIPATRNGTNTPMPDGFYVCQLGNSGFMVQDPANGGNNVYGPYASVKEAERRTWKSMAEMAKIGEELVREGLVRREVGPDGVVRFQAIVTQH